MFMGFMDIVFLLSLTKELSYKRNVQVRGRWGLNGAGKRIFAK